MSMRNTKWPALAAASLIALAGCGQEVDVQADGTSQTPEDSIADYSDHQVCDRLGSRYANSLEDAAALIGAATPDRAPDPLFDPLTCAIAADNDYVVEELLLRGYEAGWRAQGYPVLNLMRAREVPEVPSAEEQVSLERQRRIFMLLLDAGVDPCEAEVDLDGVRRTAYEVAVSRRENPRLFEKMGADCISGS